MMSVAEPVLIERRANVMIITLNRPEARNAVNRDVAIAISAAMDELDDSSELRVGVLAANGPSFCAGLDLKGFATGDTGRVSPRGFAGLTALPSRKPLIAAVEGPAMGGGFEVVLSCDLIVISELARFALPEVTRGLTAAAGGLFRLPARFPYYRAMELALTGRPMNASEAFELGLANRLVAPGEALKVALELALVVAASGPLALEATKHVIASSGAWPSDQAFELQEQVSAPVRSSLDAKEGALAFVEKRAPHWTGK